MSRDDPSQDTGPSDADAFLEAMRDVAPLHDGEAGRRKGRQQQRQLREAQTPGQAQRREDAEGRNADLADPNVLTLGEVPPVAPLEYLEWKQDGVQHAVFDKLRRGGYEVEASLDLHRKTVKEARELVFGFLKAAQAREQRSVLLSPGKGTLSKTPGRLKSYVSHWLREHPQVIAFCSAQRHHGGVGSVYALLKKSKTEKEENRQRHGTKGDPETA